jgi:8-oxo-dGTP diphosphatase
LIKPPHPRQVALIILEDALGNIALQLRDDKATIPYPNQWALFGGQVEDDEDALTAVLREVSEELTISLAPEKLSSLKIFRLETSKEHHLFSYPLHNELQQAILTEGQRFSLFSAAAIEQNNLDGRSLVPSHREMLSWYWQQKTHSNTS